MTALEQRLAGVPSPCGNLLKCLMGFLRVIWASFCGCHDEIGKRVRICVI